MLSHLQDLRPHHSGSGSVSPSFSVWQSLHHSWHLATASHSEYASHTVTACAARSVPHPACSRLLPALLHISLPLISSQLCHSSRSSVTLILIAAASFIALILSAVSFIPVTSLCHQLYSVASTHIRYGPLSALCTAHLP